MKKARPPEMDPPRAEPVGQRGKGQQRGHHRQLVGIDDPDRFGRPRLQAGGNVRQRGVGDRRIERRQRHGHQHREQRGPVAHHRWRWRIGARLQRVDCQVGVLGDRPQPGRGGVGAQRAADAEELQRAAIARAQRIVADQGQRCGGGHSSVGQGTAQFVADQQAGQVVQAVFGRKLAGQHQRAGAEQQRHGAALVDHRAHAAVEGLAVHRLRCGRHARRAAEDRMIAQHCEQLTGHVGAKVLDPAVAKLAPTCCACRAAAVWRAAAIPPRTGRRPGFLRRASGRAGHCARPARCAAARRRSRRRGSVRATRLSMPAGHGT